VHVQRRANAFGILVIKCLVSFKAEKSGGQMAIIRFGNSRAARGSSR